MVYSIAIFSTPKSNKKKKKKKTQLDTKFTPTAYLDILRSAICSATGI